MILGPKFPITPEINNDPPAQGLAQPPSRNLNDPRYAPSPHHPKTNPGMIDNAISLSLVIIHSLFTPAAKPRRKEHFFQELVIVLFLIVFRKFGSSEH